MDVRYSDEQEALRDSAAQVADRLGPSTVAELDDGERAAKLDAAVESSGWRELRTASEGGKPWAGAVEVAIVAEELARKVADASFLGPTLAAELRRLAGAPGASTGETVALARGLSEPAVAASAGAPAAGCLALDARDASSALVLVPATGDSSSAGVRANAEEWVLGAMPVEAGAVPGGAGVGGGADLTRPLAGWDTPPIPAEVPGQTRQLSAEDVMRWRSLGLAVTCADLVGVMRGALDLACDYARARTQYGAHIGSFQAIQHLLADAFVAMEGSRSVALHAAWAADALPAAEGLTSASVAKAYCGRAARTVCETAIQVHGGIGNTWECLAHVYLRRALLSTEVLGGVGDSVERVLDAYGIGDERGLR
jgi:alkylation response protein AidB-like acyl-CoA dehydrogenase